MALPDPKTAPARPDLTFLVRRSRARTPLVEEGRQGRPPLVEEGRQGPSRNQPKISFDRPDRHHETPASPPPVSSSLDLDAPSAPPPAAPPPSSVSLDLDTPAAPSAPPPAAPAPARPSFQDARVRGGERVYLSPARPTVTLNRLQSGVGTLTFEAACSPEVGDLRLGAAYELGNRFASTVQRTQGERFAPPHSRRPILLGERDQFEQISVDLRQSRDLRRLAVYAFSGNRTPLAWGGTLVVHVLGGGRIEVPLDVLSGGQVAVLMSLYNVRGEFVLRAEMQTLDGDVREAARAYGYDTISWVDERTPVS